MDQICSEESQQRNVVTVRLFTHMFRAFQRKRQIYLKNRKSILKEIADFLPRYHVIIQQNVANRKYQSRCLNQ
ncbi:unnamed protein product [Parnassius apollo]|uniref:(apollo) hypothetical protein n=1 Tax=Parnassius apollo TaxID=110799 RepID=A0A8S3X8H8_PARAO|nr:unnamed protein product [Parnassius apollo]